MLDILKKAWSLLRVRTGNEPVWASDEVAFESHFNIPYEEFCVRVSCLDQGNAELYHRTMEVNPEAAVIWAYFVAEQMR